MVRGVDSFPSPGSQPVSQRLASQRFAGGYSGTTLVFVGLAALMLGLIIGFGTMLFLRPSAPPQSQADNSDDDDADAAASPPAKSAATAAPKKPAVDPAAAARARRLAELRKKVKRQRSKAVDAECLKYKKGLPVGYVFSGGRFVENEFVANAAGCVAVAKAAKAPWFCCKK